MNISWYDTQIRYDEAFKFAMAIATRFCITDLFSVPPADLHAEDTIYRLKSVVCFVGAHYFSFIRHESSITKKAEWHYFDDDKPIQVFPSWEAVLNNILRFGYMPCLLVYERVEGKLMEYQEKPLSQYEVRGLHTLATELQEQNDAFEAAQQADYAQRKAAIKQDEKDDGRKPDDAEMESAS